MLNAYEQKQEAKRDRLNDRADKRAAESSDRLRAAARHVEGIPSGQPILVDHYSAPRHRNALAKHDRDMRKGFALQDEANELRHRAEAVGTGGISGDDPDAVEKLDDKRTALERERDHMKRVNALFKKGDREGLAALGCDFDALTARVAAAYSWEKSPFPKWQITNLGARIRDAKKRTERIETVAAMPASTETIGIATVRVDPSENRVLLSFPAKLSKDDYKRVRSSGFVWSPSRSAFVRQVSNQAVWAAKQLAEAITTTET